MALVWNGFGAYTIVAAVLVFSLGVAVIANNPGRKSNVALALTLWVEAIAGFSGGGAMYLTTDAPSAYGWQAVNVVAAGLMTPLYLNFLATLHTPMARFARHPVTIAAGWAVAAALIVPMLVWPRLVIAGIEPTWYSPSESIGGPLSVLRGVLVIPVFVFGLVVAISQYRHAPPALRPQAKAYLAAFAWRDIGFILLLILFSIVTVNETRPLMTMVLIFFPLISGGFAVLVTYGFMKAQLLDIDLRLKVSISRTTLAAIFIATFFIASEAAALFFGDRAGNQYVGIVGAGVLVFAIAPLQRLADRLSHKAMPGVADTPEYRARRKQEVYLAALEGAWADGEITSMERSMLARLQDALGLSGAEALELERRATNVSVQADTVSNSARAASS